VKLTRRQIDERVTLLRQYCKTRGLPLTHQRQVIYSALAASETHPTPEEICSQVRREMPSVSLATVYKNIKFFLDLGLLREVTALHERQLLDANLEPHHHFVCQRCKTVMDIRERDLEPVRWTISPPPGIRISGYKVEVTGLCIRCARKTKTSRSSRRRKSNGNAKL
jgi:Fur family peroxide stress response transcriptional regulator